jgi:DNA-binding NarL/FixJ family response regulator
LANTSIRRAILKKIQGYKFSPRQKQVLDLLEIGHCNKAIAEELGVTEATIKRHIHMVMKLTGCSNRTQLALLALRIKYGLPPPENRRARVAGTSTSSANRKFCRGGI